jgi:hypothetical protein
MAHSSCNGNPLVDGRGGRRRMRGSMDVVDAYLLQRSGVAVIGLKERCTENVNGLPYRTTGCTDRD